MITVVCRYPSGEALFRSASIAALAMKLLMLPTLQLGRAIYCFSFCIAEVDEGRLA